MAHRKKSSLESPKVWAAFSSLHGGRRGMTPAGYPLPSRGTQWCTHVITHAHVHTLSLSRVHTHTHGNKLAINTEGDS